LASGVAVDNFTGTADQRVTCAFSRPLGAARRFNKTFWQPLGDDGHETADDAPFVLATALYNAQFGEPSLGARMFCKITPISTEGWNGTPVILQTLVVA
jgi:hypothetical protein